MDRYGHMKPGDPCYDEHEGRQHYDGSQPLFMSEYGGTFWAQDEHQRETMQQDEGWKHWKKPEDEEEVCRRYVCLTTTLLRSEAFCGFCYTQLTDVEQEMNGLYTYERKPKFSQTIYDRIRAATIQPAAIED